MEILSQTEITSLPDEIGFIFLFLISIIILIIGLILSTCGTMERKIDVCIIGIIFIMVSIIGNLLILTAQEPTGKFIYKVTIDDTVKFKEFYNKYEIIDQEGEIYTIKEKSEVKGEMP